MFSSSHSQSSNLMSTVVGRKASELLADRSFWRGATTILNGAPDRMDGQQWKGPPLIRRRRPSRRGSRRKLNTCHFGMQSTMFGISASTALSTPRATTFSTRATRMSILKLSPACPASLFARLLYKTGGGGMAAGVPEEQRSNLSPAIWWSRYGGECPELQRRVIRLLSQVSAQEKLGRDTFDDGRECR
ncbi:uncharacterized protein LOC125209339 [Salvia hispanica]|uniref:uncharacterized protein LOC125209339 n=1 Tax=Salvia hispanica TaxID=49212 RepID=UPI0020097A6B|nr:uncharacterized protein LOC125209339 [Salvia hispanica]